MTAIHLERNVSKMAGDKRDFVPKDHNRKRHMGYQNNGHVTDGRHVNFKGAVRQYGRLS